MKMFIILLFLSNLTFAQTFMPKNDLFISVDQKNVNITHAVFNQCIDDIESLYKPIIKERFDAKLKVVRKWEDGTVNAYALQRGKNWEVHMFGGLARHKAITPDGFRAVICHELGHHAGGAPKIRNWTSSWASNEGQSDYFAMTKCLKRFFKKDIDKTLTLFDENEDTIATAKCALVYTEIEDMAICVRELKASLSLATLLAGSQEVSIESHDSTIVSRTNDKHPAAQCRLDTYVAGSLCNKDLDEIPDSEDVRAGYCVRSDGYVYGVRPLCWYKPKN